MKHAIVAILLGCSTAAWSVPATWKLTEVWSHNNVTAGYIYHTESVGTQKNPSAKVVSGLRLICSMDPSEDPIVAVFWNTLSGSSPVRAAVSVDQKLISFGAPILWDRDGPVLIRSARSSVELLQSMKTGKYFKINWETNGTVRETVFDLTQFRSGLSEFNRVCKSNL